MDRSLNDFVRACEVHIEAEQRTASPDTWLIALLCDAVRLSREMVLMQERLDARLAVRLDRLMTASVAPEGRA